MMNGRQLWDSIFQKDFIEVTRFLDENPDFDINVIHPELNATPLISAINSDDERMVKLILNFGADPNIIGSGMASALYAAVDLYLEAEDGMEGTARAIYGSVEKAIASGTYDPDENAGYLKILKLLLEKGADMNQPNFDGETAYDKADLVPAAKKVFDEFVASVKE